MSYEYQLSDFQVGVRVQLHPCTDAWMRGDRYGTVAKVTKAALHIRMDRSGHVFRIKPNCVGWILES